MSSDPWLMYNMLIEKIPENLVIEECIVGLHWVVVRSIGVGLAMTPPDDRSVEIAGSVCGRKVKEIAELSKSWKPLEAAIGTAALNSFYNAPVILTDTWGTIENRQSEISVFTEVLPMVEGKKVAVIGHFPDLDGIAKVADLSILERRPQKGDYPDPSCEFILPQQDYVFMTGVTFTNKTLIRLLELSKDSFSVLVGPSVPLTPLLFNWGVNLLAGTVVIDETRICKHIKEGGDRSIFRNGAMMIRLQPNGSVS